ncbi:nucleotide-binding protein [Lysinibacter cavernae]|uniref:nucleotide-binding protein n=1 Tax=Lysinibacter cavernae TaxID=1640652 RepID=UPI0036DE6A7E
MVVINYAGKGGVGKSSLTILEAQMLAEQDLRVCVVDANRGQADLVTNLKIGRSDPPTIYTAKQTGDFDSAIITPEQMASIRDPRMGALAFSVVLGPPDDLAAPEHTSAGLYADLVDYLRAHFDVVIVDTQIIEAHLTDLWQAFLIPLLISGAWGVGITDESDAGETNLFDRMRSLADLGVGDSHQLVVANRFHEFTEEDAQHLEQKFNLLGSFVGGAIDDPYFESQMNMGSIVTNSTEMAPVLRAILYRIVPLEQFAPQIEATKKRPWLPFGKRGKK